MRNYAIIGFGGLGKKHLVNLKKLEAERGDFRLKAICGANPAALKEKVVLNLGTVDLSELDLSDCKLYDDYKEMIEKEDLDFVFSVLPTYLHEEVATYAMEKGLDVFSEKPMALTLDGCAKMIEVSEKHGKKLMIGQCLRFAPAFRKLKEIVENETFGKAYSAEFIRYSQMPKWTWQNWILDPARSGGAPWDFHVHDVDMINYLFGKPKSVRAVTTNKKLELEAIFGEFEYDGLTVSARADWSLPQTFPFEARALIRFENALVSVTAEKLTVYEDERSYAIELDEIDYFEAEMRAFLKLVIEGEVCKENTPQSVYESMKIVDTEIKAAKKGEKICF